MTTTTRATTGTRMGQEEDEALPRGRPEVQEVGDEDLGWEETDLRVLLWDLPFLPGPEAPEPDRLLSAVETIEEEEEAAPLGETRAAPVQLH